MTTTDPPPPSRRDDSSPAASHHGQPLPESSPDWMRDALCAQADPEAWFPEKGSTPRPARAVCNGTEAGYKAHRRLGEDACRACLDGNRDARRRRAAA